MAGIELILGTDTLETGFRAKANNNFNEQIVGYQLLTNNTGAYTGILRLIKFNGGFINVDLSLIYYTQAQIGAIVAALSSSPYSGAWSNIAPYAAQSVVDYEGILYRSSINNNTDIPGTTGTWIDVLTAATTTIEKMLTGADPQDYIYAYAGDVSKPGLLIYAELQTSQPNPATSIAEDVYSPYALTYFKFTTDNTILLRRSDPGDIVKVTIKQL
jgi:hypothetical protein